MASILEKLKAKSKKQPIDLDIDEKLFIKSMSGFDRASFVRFSADEKELSLQNAFLVSISLVDDDGKYVFDGVEPVDILMCLEAEDIDKIVNESLDLNGLSEKASKKAKKN